MNAPKTFSCLSQHYRERLRALRTQWQAAVAYQPDDLDELALDDLQKRIQAASKDDPEFALDRALAALAVKTTAGGFDGDANEDDSSITHFPTAQPKGVTANEWRALSASRITDAAETGLTLSLPKNRSALFRLPAPVKTITTALARRVPHENFPADKTKPQLLSQLGFRNLILTMTYSHMGKPHTTIGDASFHC
jgi:hypothetical protein